MKNSRYNWYVRRGETSLIYNCFSGAMYELDEEHSHLARLLEVPGECLSDGVFDDCCLRQLESSGFLVADDFDERAHLESLMEAARCSCAMKLTVVITRQCNFHCSYCIQRGGFSDRSVIDEEVIHRLREMLFDLGPTAVHTTLYGGEPLLCPEACFKTLEAVRTVHPGAGAMLVTNGYLLTGDLAARLRDYGVSAAQITLDGPEEIHDRRRRTRDGRGTYGRILENTLAASKYMRILLRVNVESGMEFDYTEFRNRFNSNRSIHVYRAPTTYFHQGSQEQGARNFHAIENSVCGDELYRKKLNARFPGCASTTRMCAVILPEGRLVRCWNQVQDPSDSYSVSKQGLLASYELWRKWNPFHIPECSECRMLPICGGGCPDRSMKTGKPQCRFTPGGFEDFIHENFKARKNSARKEVSHDSYQPPGDARPWRHAR